jgi:hypothetical protein
MTGIGEISTLSPLATTAQVGLDELGVGKYQRYEANRLRDAGWNTTGDVVESLPNLLTYGLTGMGIKGLKNPLQKYLTKSPLGVAMPGAQSGIANKIGDTGSKLLEFSMYEPAYRGFDSAVANLTGDNARPFSADELWEQEKYKLDDNYWKLLEQGDPELLGGVVDNSRRGERGAIGETGEAGIPDGPPETIMPSGPSVTGLSSDPNVNKAIMDSTSGAGWGDMGTPGTPAIPAEVTDTTAPGSPEVPDVPPADVANPNVPAEGQERKPMGEAAANNIDQEAYSQLPPEDQNVVAEQTANIENQVKDPRRKEEAANGVNDLINNPESPEHETAKQNLFQQLGTTWEETTKTYDSMGPGAKAMMWLGGGLTAVGLLQSVMGDGGMLGWLGTILGLGLGAGAAAYGGMFGEGAREGMHGLADKARVGLDYLSGYTPSDFAKNYSKEDLVNSVFPMATQFGAITPEIAKKLNQAVSSVSAPELPYGVSDWNIPFVGGTVGSHLSDAANAVRDSKVGAGLAEYGISDPAIQRRVLDAWREYKNTLLQ